MNRQDQVRFGCRRLRKRLMRAIPAEIARVGGSVVGIQLKDGRFGVNVYDLDDDGEVAASTGAGVFNTLSEAADRAVLLLVQC
jgi:hypothetical protein